MRLLSTRFVWTNGLPFLLLLLLPNLVYASHNRAGEIQIEQIGSLTIRATIITYTKASSVLADRDSLEICWGDGSCEFVQRANGGGNGVVLGNDIRYNIYVSEHTYGGRATYVISMTDQNRNGSVLNVNLGNSDAVAFHIQTTYTFLNTQFQGFNSTPQLLQPPVDKACVGQPFVHNPNAYDVDGDSLAYFLIVPLSGLNTNVPLFQFPNAIGSNPLDFFSLNSVTGDMIWESPEVAGEYNVAMIIVSYRDGFAIDTTVRDMQILVEDCDNVPPIVDAPLEICVIAGDTIVFDVSCSDADTGQLVRLSALGGPFVVPQSPAVFEVASGYQTPVLTGTFTWITTCEHIAEQYYSVVFKGSDNYFDTTGLADLKLVKIKVIAPPPLNVAAEPQSGQVKVSWERPYTCEDAADNYFFRFGVWRRIGANPFELDTCDPGLDGKGYTRIAYLEEYPTTANRYEYFDTEVERGRTYCYRILADFAKQSSAGNPYNLVSSLASEEVCLQLSRDIPLMLNVDVVDTDVANGSVFVRWSKPNADDLDTLQNLPPYRYQLLHAESQVGPFLPVAGADFTANSFATANDTFFTHTGLNTLQNMHFYRLAFYINNETEPLGNSEVASSVFLTVASTDEINNLSWTATTPWTNSLYDIFKRNNATGVFDSIATVSVASFADTGLVNGTTYCYYVRSYGSYGIPGLPSPLVNRSQRVCGVPLDTIPPCIPSLSLENPCANVGPNTPIDSFQNHLIWTNPLVTCPQTDDLVGYRIYYSSDSSGAGALLAEIPNAFDTEFWHSGEFGLAGCYSVTAYDTLGNESLPSPLVCADNCPLYFLPNTFTPNGDGSNDFFVPYPYRYIASVDFEVRNQWGNVLYRTTDPALGWDGTNLQGQPVAEGTYFYVCKVFELRLNGAVLQAVPLAGFIEVVR